MNELIEAITTRIRSHFFSSIVISFILYNWKPLFYLLNSDKDVLIRFAYVQKYFVFAEPLAVGYLVAILAPYVALAGTQLAKEPFRKIKWHEAKSESKLKVDKIKLEKEEADAETDAANARSIKSQAVTQEMEDSRKETEATISDLNAKSELASLISKIENQDLNLARGNLQNFVADLKITSSERDILRNLYNSNTKAIYRKFSDGKFTYIVDDVIIGDAKEYPDLLSYFIRLNLMEEAKSTGLLQQNIYVFTKLGEKVVEQM